ncbi:hypothetical protein DNFV4_02548 [Nitrospira tepida]|uniref:Mutator family transposase n=1 Tax=Nitrospira tepida TaxID=2973512 RepID=A0AA86MZU0_9BACT|nr:transposase [Nitrospira tepida]CAI4032123.1 hypothetical protein DNFV4_02548 [Nitrospira tepida]
MLPIVRTQDGAQESEQAVATALDELAREGARRMILAALEVEAEEYRQRHRDARDPRGHALVVHNGQARPRRLTVGTGTITIRAPRGNERRRVDEVWHKFISRILPPYLRARPRSAPCPLLYLHGLSTGDFREALPALLEADAAGISPAAITRLTATWRTE